MKSSILLFFWWTLLLDCNGSSAAAQQRRILVTGAAGFVGSHVARHLLERGDDVVVVDEVNDYYDVKIKEANLRALRESFGDSRVSIHRGDIGNGGFLDDVFQQQHVLAGGFDAICHMAARAGVRPSIGNPSLYVHSNVKATVELLERAVKFNVSNFVFASSSSVYGGSKSKYFSETEQVDRPISPYAATKRSCELFGQIYQRRYGLSVTALRFFTVYGPRGRPDMAPFKFIDRISRQVPIQQFGDGSSSRDYTFVDDIVDGVVRAVDKPTGAFRLLNLGRGSGTSLKKFLETIELYVGKAAQIERLPDQPGDVPYTCANVTLAKSLLGYRAYVPIEEGIKQTVDWYQKDYGDQTSSTSVGEASNAAPKLSDSRHMRIDRSRGYQKVVLLTGGGGHFEGALARSLVDQNKKVVLVEYAKENSSSVVNNNLKLLSDEHGDSGLLSLHRGDLRSAGFLRNVFQQEAPTSICHLGWAPARTSWSDPLKTINATVDLTLALLELSRGSERGAYDVDNFVLASTSHLYLLEEKQGSSTTIQRDDAINNPYNVAKKTEELLSYTFHHLYGIPVTAVRLEEANTSRILENDYVKLLSEALEVHDGYNIYNTSSCIADDSSLCSLAEAALVAHRITDEHSHQDDNWLFSSLLSAEHVLRLIALSQWSVVIIIVGLSRFTRFFRK